MAINCLIGLILVLLTNAPVYAYQLPDPALTPGVVAITEAPKVCGILWGRDVRHVTQKMKKQVCQAYGAKECPGPKWELDHLVSRELGGADDVKNLFPQPIKEARVKDRVENFLHRQVCSGKMQLQDVQRGIANNWVQYIRLLPTKGGL